MLSKIFRAAALAISVGACGGGFHADEYPQPRTLARAAVDAAAAGECSSTDAPLRRVLFELPPRDPLIPEVRMALAECQMESHAFLEASRQFRRVADDFPASPTAADALLRSGDALARLWRRPELDPTYGENAMATYVEVLNRFPGSDQANEAREKISTLRSEFAEKEFKNAEYYFRIRAFDSAIIYYRGVVENYPQSEYAPRAMLRLVSIFARLGYDDERNDSCTYLRRFHPEEEGVSEACPV